MRYPNLVNPINILTNETTESNVNTKWRNLSVQLCHCKWRSAVKKYSRRRRISNWKIEGTSQIWSQNKDTRLKEHIGNSTFGMYHLKFANLNVYIWQLTDPSVLTFIQINGFHWQKRQKLTSLYLIIVNENIKISEIKWLHMIYKIILNSFKPDFTRHSVHICRISSCQWTLGPLLSETKGRYSIASAIIYAVFAAFLPKKLHSF